jgi:hypothetical protein
MLGTYSPALVLELGRDRLQGLGRVVLDLLARPLVGGDERARTRVVLGGAERKRERGPDPDQNDDGEYPATTPNDSFLPSRPANPELVARVAAGRHTRTGYPA